MMTTDQLINSAIAFATFAAALAAWRAARAAKTQGDAAWEQVKLQRPRPVIIVEASWNLEKDSDEPDSILVRNVGSSPAFDVDLSEIEGPVLQTQGYRERLVTDRIFVVGEQAEIRAVHHRIVPGTPIGHLAALGFVKAVAGSPAPMDKGGDPHRPLLEFSLGYSALDGRRFEVPCRIQFWLGFNARAEIVPVSGWLGGESA
jgi:hypothetical protein